MEGSKAGHSRHYSANDTEHDEAQAVCAAVDPTHPGGLCRQPAIGIDYQGGYPVCREHLDAYLTQEEKR